MQYGQLKLGPSKSTIVCPCEPTLQVHFFSLETCVEPTGFRTIGNCAMLQPALQDWAHKISNEKTHSVQMCNPISSLIQS